MAFNLHLDCFYITALCNSKNTLAMIVDSSDTSKNPITLSPVVEMVAVVRVSCGCSTFRHLRAGYLVFVGILQSDQTFYARTNIFRNECSGGAILEE